MTAEIFLHTRAKAVYETWAQDLPGTLMFFTGHNSTKRKYLPVVPLKGVDDTYPPQRKSQMMLKHMYDNYGDDYEWFLRSDDDVYVRPENLHRFLRKFNSNEDIYLGQAGQGLHDEDVMLGLEGRDNFCMGGPTVVLSASTLRKVAPHVEDCLKHTASTHEDVEVGRCIKRYVGISCTSAFEMQSLFLNHPTIENLDTEPVRNAITLHPLKNPKSIYRVHAHYKQLKMMDLTFLRVQYERSRNIVKQLLNKGIANLTETEVVALNDINDFHKMLDKAEEPAWESFTPSKVYSSISNSPEIGMLNPMKDLLKKVQDEAMSLINQDVHDVLYRTLEFKKLNHGYRRYHPLHGMQYKLDLILKYHRHIGKKERGMTVYVHHNAYLQQPLGTLMYSVSTITLQTNVRFILPLAGRLSTFKRFMANYEEACLKTGQKTTLIISYFMDVSPSDEHKKLYQSYKAVYTKASLEWINVQGPFSRSSGLNIGSAQYAKSSLLFFCDVDMEFTAEFINRCRANTILGKQVYYPIVFSQMSSEIYPKIRKNDFSKDAGIWRHFGFGITCQYLHDFEVIGRFNAAIHGWGNEDVELYDRFVKSGKYTIIRAHDAGLIHIYHEKTCDKNLPKDQLNMCYGSKAAIYASQRKAYEQLIDKNYIAE